MTTIIVASNPASGSNTGIARTLNQAATVGNSLIAWLHHTASTTDTMTGAIDNASNAFTQDYTAVDSLAGEGIRVYRRSNIGNAATSFTPQASVATGVYGGMVEVAGMDNAAPYVGTTYLTEAGTLSHSIAFTTTTPNAIVVVGVRHGASFNGVSSLAAGWGNVGLARISASMFYNPDCGAPGAKTLTFTSASNVGTAHYYITEYKAAVTDPTVSTVTGTTVTEGGSIVYTVTLSGATNRTTNYAAGFTGGTATGADYDSALGNATYSAGVTFSGGNMVVPTAVSSFTFTVATTQDTLDEADETVFPTVGGVAAVTGTITDNDPAPTVTFSDGVESFGVVTCVATLGAVSGKDVKFDVSTANGSKTAGTHYTAIVAQTVTIPAGSLTAAITVNTL